MTQTILVTVTSVLSATLTVCLSHFLSRRRNREDDLNRIRIQSYVDYVGASMRMALARRQKNDEAYLRELPVYNDAKAKICFCAPEPVLRCMIDFHSQGIDLEEEQRVSAGTSKGNGCGHLSGNTRADGNLGHLALLCLVV
jgi:hypothetical protein